MFIDVISASLDDFWPGVFVLAIGGDLRPPRGMAGLVDWRLGGAISDMVLDGRLTGETAEQTLLWSERRKSKIYIFGIGNRLPPSHETTRKIAGQILLSVIKAGERQVVLIPDPILTVAGDRGAEGAFLEGIMESCAKAGDSAREFRFLVPGSPKETEEIHEAFRRAILRLGHKAEGVSLSRIEGQFALHI